MRDSFQATSTNIAGAEYDDATRDMTVSFTSGESYTYWGVDQATWDGFKQATSKGSYFHRTIKGRFNYTQE